ncbi:hypothetical protein Hdeb2414_s0013g00413261 [Helianthus debilis subsp. tardiflorus]
MKSSRQFLILFQFQIRVDKFTFRSLSLVRHALHLLFPILIITSRFDFYFSVSKSNPSICFSDSPMVNQISRLDTHE